MNIEKLCPHCLREIYNKETVTECPHCHKSLGHIENLPHHLKQMTVLAGKYLVGDVIGEGGFGITYVGLDLNLELKVAIKEFYPNGYATRENKTTTKITIYSGKNEETVKKWRESFINEARSLAKFSGLKGVVGVKDFFQENNTAYIIMEYVEGETLKNYMKKNGGKVDPAWLFKSIEPVMIALGQIHKAGIIHRDISPDNIMLMPDGSMKLLDFGAARSFEGEGEKSLSVMLKPGYAPEEQYRSHGKQGPWSDVYALGGTIYKAITGVTPPESMERLRKDELLPPRTYEASLTDTQENAILKAMALFAENRYQTMEEFHEGIYETDQAAAVKDVKSTKDIKNIKRKNYVPLIAVSSSMILILALVLFLMIYQRHRLELAGKEAVESEIRSTENDELSSETDEGETIEEETSEEEADEEASEEEEIDITAELTDYAENYSDYLCDD
ncbi:serine/threonine protein kinase [Lachnospiraceae bacterium C1.1]|nr:serine/threonine-protein kinase [Lachnospiraceae bacterium C1.1]